VARSTPPRDGDGRAALIAELLDRSPRQFTTSAHLAATITPELLPVLCPNNSDRPEGRSQINGIAGAGFEPATFGL
jgi:hypothetical protein